MGAADHWLMFAPLWLVATVMLIATGLTVWLGSWLRRRAPPAGEEDAAREGYVVSAVFGIAGLLVGFTFSMAIDRFDTRRSGVLDEANAIEASYLKVQLLEEPHRARISRLLTVYTDNRINFAEADPGDYRDRLEQRSDALLTELWAATVAAFPTIKSYDLSSSFVDGMASIAEMDAARKAARRAHVPSQVYGVLFLYQLVTAAVVGYALSGKRGGEISGLLLLLFALSILLVLQLDRPSTGRIKEPQQAMLQLQRWLHERPPAVFDMPAAGPAQPAGR